MRRIVKIGSVLCGVCVGLCLNLNCKTQQNDIQVYKVVPSKPAFNSKKYNLVDTTLSVKDLSAQAYNAENTFERMQIYDYLLVYDPQKAGLNEFFRFFDSEQKDWHGTREMGLITAAIDQDQYSEIKQVCLRRMIRYQMINGNLDSAVYYMDVIRKIEPEKQSDYDNYNYDLVSTAAATIRDAKSNTKIGEPERLWRIGYAYWKVAYSEFKSPWRPCCSSANDSFDKIINDYQESPYVVNVIFARKINEYKFAHEDTYDTTCGIDLSQKFLKLLDKYPLTTARDEILFNRALVYFCKATQSQDSASILDHLHKADSVFSGVNPYGLFDEESYYLYDAREADLYRYFHRYERRQTDFNGKLFGVVFLGWDPTELDTSGLLSILKRRIKRYVRRYKGFVSQLGAVNLKEEDNRRRIERLIVTLVDMPGIEEIAAQYARSAVIYKDWEMMSERPFEEAEYAEHYLNTETKIRKLRLRPFLHLFLAHRYRCAYEIMVFKGETKKKDVVAVKYNQNINAAKNSPNLLISLTAGDMEKLPYLYVDIGVNP